VKRKKRKENNRKEKKTIEKKKERVDGCGRGWRTDKDEWRRMLGALVLVI
jgi:hypothetical protein